jgi:hypothetical protein
MRLSNKYIRYRCKISPQVLIPLNIGLTVHEDVDCSVSRWEKEQNL